MTLRQTSMLLLSLYEIHCSYEQKMIRHGQNRINYKKWLKQIREPDKATNRKAFKLSHHYLRTLSLDEFAVKTLKVLPEIDL